MDVQVIPRQGQDGSWLYELWTCDDRTLLGTCASGPEAMRRREVILVDLVGKPATVVHDAGPRLPLERYQVWKVCLADAQTEVVLLDDGRQVSPGCPHALYCSCQREASGALTWLIASYPTLEEARRHCEVLETARHTPLQSEVV